MKLNYHDTKYSKTYSMNFFLIFLFRIYLKDFLFLLEDFPPPVCTNISISLYTLQNKILSICEAFGTYRRNAETTMIGVKYISLHFITWKIEYEINIRLTLSAFLSSPYFACAVDVAEGYSN